MCIAASRPYFLFAVHGVQDPHKREGEDPLRSLQASRSRHLLGETAGGEP